MLTELFLLGVPSSRGRRRSQARAATFGEALQLVNILKDSEDDRNEGRRYLPEPVPKAEIFALARRDLETAEAYIETLRAAGSPRGILEFTALPYSSRGRRSRKWSPEVPARRFRAPRSTGSSGAWKRALDRASLPFRAAAARRA